MNVFLTFLLACGAKETDTSSTDTEPPASHPTALMTAHHSPKKNARFRILHIHHGLPLTYNEENTCWEQGERNLQSNEGMGWAGHHIRTPQSGWRVHDVLQHLHTPRMGYLR